MLSGNFSEMTTSTPFRDLLHAANLLNGTDGFTSPPKEGVLRIISPLKIRLLRPGLNPRTWILKASTLPLDHRRRSIAGCVNKIFVQHFLQLGSAGPKIRALVSKDIILANCKTSEDFILLTVHGGIIL